MSGTINNNLWNDWNKLFDEDRRTELRSITVELSDRLAQMLEQMFQPDQNIGWESWLLRICEDSVCRQAFGIPAHYDHEQISSILMGDIPGLPSTLTTALRMRIEIAFNLLAKVLAHPLCPKSSRRFAKEFSAVRKSLRRASEQNGKWLSPNHDLLLKKEVFNKNLAGDSGAPNRSIMRNELQHYRQSQLDSEYYALLLTVDSARNNWLIDNIDNKSDPEANAEADKHWTEYETNTKIILSSLLKLACYDDSFESNVMPWWCYAEIVYAKHDREITRGSEEGDAEYKGLNKIIGTLMKDDGYKEKSKAPKTVYDIEEYSEIKSLPLMQVAIAAMTVYQNHIDVNITNCITTHAYGYIEKVFSGNGNKGQSQIAEGDHGFLAVLSTRLFCLLEYWKWQTLHEAHGCAGKKERVGTGSSKGKEFGSTANNPRNDKYLTWPIWRALEKLFRYHDEEVDKDTKKNPLSKKLLQHSDGAGEPEELEELAGTAYSCVLLGPPGIGKGAIVEELWLFNETEVDEQKKPREEQKAFYINKTPYEIDSHWLDGEADKIVDSTDGSRVLDNFIHGEPETLDVWHDRDKVETTIKGKSCYYLVFIDEVHLPSVVSPYGLLLKPIQEGHPRLKIKGVDRAVYVFATSAYRTKEHFQNEASTKKDAAMRDFATRIDNWIVLPDLYTVPEQKFLMVSEILKKKWRKAHKKCWEASTEKKWEDMTKEDQEKELIMGESSLECIEDISIKFVLNLEISSTREIISEINKYKNKIFGEDDNVVILTVPEVEGMVNWPKWETLSLFT